ncbi:hypothetical protein [Kribbella sp. CA-247076]|uniref:hypothetical protein n=1 Tax=Kribbella sp. CA-247076 TaxID=3239941 RepID=UPI003D90E7D6
MPGNIWVTNAAAFDDAYNQMGQVASDFSTGMGVTGQESASPAAKGGTIESGMFMQQERQARDLLAQFMTKTSDGLQGYQSAILRLGEEHKGLVHLNNQRLSALLKPGDGPVQTDPAFDWRRAVDYQNSVYPNGGR